MHLSMHMQYKTQLATTLSGVSSGLPAHLRIFDQVASEQSHAKTRACIFMVFMCGFFAVSNIIHPNLFTIHQPFFHCFVEKISNNGVCIVGSVDFFRAKSPRI